jgi:hypothetical protein
VVIVLYTSVFLKLYIYNFLFYVCKIYMSLDMFFFLYKNFNISLCLLYICSVLYRYECYAVSQRYFHVAYCLTDEVKVDLSMADELCEEILSRLKCVQLMMVFFNILIVMVTLVVARNSILMSANAAVVEDVVFL